MKSQARVRLKLSATTLIFGVLLAGCGGGGDSSDSTNEGAGSSNPPATTVQAPSGLSYPSPQALQLGAALTTLTPAVSGTVSSYSVAPALPAGLSLNATTGTISGTPSQTSPATTYTITASNAAGSATFSLSLKVFTVLATPGNLSRIAADAASIYLDIVLKPVNLDVGSLYVAAQDPTGIILPNPDVVVNTDGTYTVTLATNPSVSPNVFVGDLRLNLCRDVACATPLEMPYVLVPFSVTVLSSTSAWPGDHQTALVAWQEAPDWSTLQGNASHTGFVPVAVNPNQFTTRWKTTGNAVSGNWSIPKANLTTANGLFYVVSATYLNSGVLYAKREFDASAAWQYSFTGMTYPEANPAAVKNGVVYVPAGHQNETYMFAFDASNGSLVYRSPMSSQWENYLAPTIGPNGMLYANAGTYGGLYAFNPSGNQLFFAYEAQQSNWTPAVDDTGVYVYTGALRVHDLLTGQVLHDIPDPTYQNYIYEIGGAPVLGAPGSVFAVAYSNSVLNGGAIGNTLSNFRTSTDSIAWQIPGVYPTTPGYKAGVLYATNHNPLRLEARAESNGALLWWWTPPAPGDSRFVSEVLLTNNLVFVSTDRATYAIDLKTHRPVFSYPAQGKLALSANGILYIHNSVDLTAINLK